MVNIPGDRCDGQPSLCWELATPHSHTPAILSLIPRLAMLKHKLRKSRKNILNLLEFHEEDEKRATIPEYSEIKKTGRKDKKKKGIKPTTNICNYLEKL